MKHALPLIFSCLLLASCGGSSSSLSRITSSSSLPASSSVAPSSSQEASGEVSSQSVLSSAVESSSKPFLASDINEDNLNEFVPHYLDKVASFSSYKAVTKGSTVAKVLFIETTQSIDVTAIKGEYCYLKNESHSNLVNTVHEAYTHQSQVVYADNGAAFQKIGLEDYLNTYGVNPFERTIEGYDCGPDSIKSIEKVASEQGYAFKISFDTEKATNNVRIQMKAFGGLDDYPSFSSIAITVTVKEDFTPVIIDVDANYKAKKIMESDCHQSYQVTFSSFDESIEIAGLDKIKADFSL